MKRTNHFTSAAWPIGVIFLTFIVSLLIFKQYVYAPNQYMYAFGGDALVIYYDMIYHTLYDSGPMLMNMNYPHGEYIYLTDAQGAFSNVLQWVQKHLFDISDYIVGIVHIINLALLPLCSLFVFYILKHFGVRNIVALLFAVLITFLSPQIFRYAGHFGLAYPFVIPMAIWWLLRKFKENKFEKRDLFVLAVLVFFTFNNPYVGFAAAGFLMSASGLLFIISIKDRSFLKRAAIVGIVGLLAVLIPYLDFHFFDPVNDRLKHQWGFFHYFASLKGMLYPPNSILHSLLETCTVQLPKIKFESRLNIGFVNCMILLFIIGRWLVRIGKKGKQNGSTSFLTEQWLLFGAGLIMFLYAASGGIFAFAKDWIEDLLGPLLMFKASGRIGWSFYYVISILFVAFLDRHLQKMKTPAVGYAFLLIAVLVWAYEIKQYVGPKYENCFHANYFSLNKQNEILDILRQNDIDTDDYQAMLVLPKLMAWTDIFKGHMNWSSQFYSMRISAATGLPTINAMLSRMSIGQSADAIQMLSHPVVERELLDKLPNQKDILLLLGGEHPPLSIGEQFLIEISEPVYRSDHFLLYRLKIDDIRNNAVLKNARDLFAAHEAPQKDIVHLSFEGEKSEMAFYGNGAKKVAEGTTLILDTPLPVDRDTQLVFSVWTNIDYQKYGNIRWKITVTDSLGKITFQDWIMTQKSNEIQDMWIRSEVVVPAARGSSLRAAVKTNKEIYVDELLVYPKGAELIIDNLDSEYFMYNGFKVKKE